MQRLYNNKVKTLTECEFQIQIGGYLKRFFYINNHFQCTVTV